MAFPDPAGWTNDQLEELLRDEDPIPWDEEELDRQRAQDFPEADEERLVALDEEHEVRTGAEPPSHLYADHIIGRHRWRVPGCPACDPTHPEHAAAVEADREWDRAEAELYDQ